MSLKSFNMSGIYQYLADNPIKVGVGVVVTFLGILIPFYLHHKLLLHRFHPVLHYLRSIHRHLNCLIFRHRRFPPVLSGITASSRPAIAIQMAADHIAHGRIATLGEMLFFLRGNLTSHIVVDDSVRAQLVRVLGTESSPAVDPLPKQCVSPRLAPMLRGLLRCTEKAAQLESERATPFSSDNAAHVQLLRELWAAAGKSPEGFAQRSAEWNGMGFQGLDPTTDLRGGGVLSLRQLAHFAQSHKAEFRSMMEYNRAMLEAGENCWYLPAVVSIQLTAEILLRQYDFCLPQLETLYDTVRYGDGGGRARAAIAFRHGDDSAQEAVWAHESDFEIGFFTLHHQLLLHFKKCWHRDRPHVMEFGTYLPTVLKSFFTPDE